MDNKEEETSKKIPEGTSEDDNEQLDKTENSEKKKTSKYKNLLSQNFINNAFKKLSLRSPDFILDEPTYECFIKCFKEKKFKNIITIAGAGISTSAGIPDFRSPDTGIYENLSKYNLPYPQAIFEIDYFEENPAPFYDLAKQLIPGNFQPTLSHHFIRLLELKDLLLRHYTQNVDGLERRVGISDERLIEAHGSFNSSHCTRCNRSYSFEWLRQEMYASNVPTCVICNVVVKPDIVFFGESLPKKFFQCIKNDFNLADLLIIMGSSLSVEPFASLVQRVNRHCTRVIINDQEVGRNVGIIYDPRQSKRDVFIKGSCDESCMKIITEMGWQDEIDKLIHPQEISNRN